MVDSSVSFQLVSVAEAARILSVSDSTVRRLLKAGRLEAEQVQRPQGHIWLVKVPSPANQPPDQPSRQIGAAGANPSAPPALAAWMTSVLEPLVLELSTSRHQLVSQAETIGTLRAERDAARSENEALRASQTKQDANPGLVVPEATTDAPVSLLARLRALAPWLLAVLAIGAVIVLLAWPR